MSSRFADPTTMRTRSPIYHDEGPKRPPPSPSNKAPPLKRLDAKSRAVSEESFLPSKAQVVPALPSEPLVESFLDRSSGNRVVVDMDVFGQILELDDPDDPDNPDNPDEREFSRGMVKDYLDQAKATIEAMDKRFANHASSSKHEELTELGRQGHFLKGSSAALGVVQVREICEKIQHLGNRLDPDKKPPEPASISVDDAFAKIRPLLARLKDEHAAAEKWLNKFIVDGFKP